MKKLLLLGVFILSFLYFTSCSEDSGETLNELSAPILLDPSNQTFTSFEIAWIGDATATNFLLDVAENVDFTNKLPNYNNRTTSGESLTISGLSDNTRYFVRLRAIRNDEQSAYSLVKSITTLEEPDPIEEQPEMFLRELTNLPIGAAVQAGRLNGSYANRVVNEHSSLSAEFEMKMETNFTGINQYNYDPGDAIVEFAKANNMQVHGHTLIWHSSVPKFLEDFTGTNEEFESLIRTYIQETVSRYKGAVVSWDVVNEAFEEDGTLRNTIFSRRLGNDFIAKCFQWAHEADPDALLFYNDFNILFNEDKLNGALDAMAELKQRGIQVDGIGFQSHIDIFFPSRTAIANALQKAVNADLLVHISELDIKVNPRKEENFIFNNDFADRQTDKFKEVVEEFLKIPEEKQFAITLWGVRDSQSWIPLTSGVPDFPLLFNDNLLPKPAHTGFAEVLLEHQ